MSRTRTLVVATLLAAAALVAPAASQAAAPADRGNVSHPLHWQWGGQ